MIIFSPLESFKIWPIFQLKKILNCFIDTIIFILIQIGDFLIYIFSFISSGLTMHIINFSSYLIFKLNYFKLIIDYNISFSIPNTVVSLFVLSFVLFLFLVNVTLKPKLTPSYPQLIIEIFFEHMVQLIGRNLGRRGMIFFPYIATIYLLLIGANFLGAIPYTSVITTQIIITSFIGFSIFIGSIILGIYYHKWYFVTNFLPSGVSKAIAPILVIIELITFIFRPISLSVRIFANILAGHILFIIIVSFAHQLLMSSGIQMVAGILALVLLFFITILETVVQFIQAYVFILMSSMYLNSAFYLDH